MTSANRMTRIHAPFVSESEIEKINNFLRNQAEPDYVDEILNFVDEKETNSDSNNDENLDELYNTALEIVKSEKGINYVALNGDEVSQELLKIGSI